MNNLKNKIITLALLLFALSGAAHAQTALKQTSLNVVTNISASQTSFVLTSTSGVTSQAIGSSIDLYIDRELMAVLTVNTTTNTVVVARGQGGTQASPHANAAMVLVGPPQAFQAYDPEGYCVTANTAYTPWVNVKTGNQWLCSTVSLTWAPGFGNSIAESAVTTAVASAAGAILPSGPLFHVTGTAAVTGFTIPVGCNATTTSGCSFIVIPDGAFTWTTAGNIATAGTAVANLAIKFTWDATNSKFVVLQSK